jgi:hypothetical protein
MLTSLHLTHLDPIVSSNSLTCFQHLDRILLIGKIFFSIQVFHRYLLFRHTHTSSVERYGTHHAHQTTTVVTPIVGYFTSLLHNLERSNESWCELTSYFETAQTTHRWHLEVHKISNIKAQLSSSMTSVALLPWLRNSQVLSHHTNLLLGFLQYVGSKTFCSPVSLQNNGGWRQWPYSISNGTIFKLS